MAWQALPQQLAQLPHRQQHRQAKPCRQRHSHPQTRAAVLSTPVEEQAQRKSTLEKLQSAVTITAAKTPYLENGKIDLRMYDRLVERQIEGGVEGVIVGGTTGEGQVHSPPTDLSPVQNINLVLLILSRQKERNALFRSGRTLLSNHACYTAHGLG